MEQRHLLIKLSAVPAFVLIIALVYVFLSIPYEEKRQPGQHLDSSDSSEIKPALTVPSGVAGGNSGNTQSREDDYPALQAEKERQKVTECAARASGTELPLRCSTLESDLELVLHKRKQQDEVAKKGTEGLTLLTEKRRSQDLPPKKEVDDQASKAGGRLQEDATDLETKRLALEAEKRRQDEAAEHIATERLALEAEKKLQEETAAQNEAERIALNAARQRQEDVAAQNEAERLALVLEKQRREEEIRNDAERLAAAENKRQEEATAGRPEAAGEATASGNTDQKLAVPSIIDPASAPGITIETCCTGSLNAPVAAPQRTVGTALSPNLPLFAPSRVVLTYPRNDTVAAERMAALRQALTAANVEVVKVEAVDAARPTLGLGYYFRSDHDAAVDISQRFQPLIGLVEPGLLEMPGKVPPPGTVEIAIPGRRAR